MTNRGATSVLRVSDYDRAKAFYTDVLGFEPAQEADAPATGTFRSGLATITLDPLDASQRLQLGGRGYFHVADLSDIITRLTDLGQAFKGPTDTFYKTREIEVTDPDGNVLCFGTDLPKETT